MFELLFLGTSASAPSVRRGLPSSLVTHNEFRFLVDCGEGTQRQILTAGAGLKKLNRILITHSHLDHILGLAGLVSTMVRWETIDDLHIYAGPDAIDRIHDLLFSVVLRGQRTKPPIFLHKLTPGVFIQEKDLTVSCFPVIHRGTDSFGFLFKEKDRRPFIEENAEALGLPPGPIRKELVNGHPVTLDDGRVIQPDDVLGETIHGVVLAMVGDTGEIETLRDPVQDADALVIEATYTQEEADMAQLYSHITASQSAQLAKESNVGSLILTHLSRRYREKDILTEAQSVFPNTFVARDFSEFDIKKGETIRVISKQ